MTASRQSVPATLPYVGTMGARVACRHEWGGQLAAQWWDLKPFWGWLTWLSEAREQEKRIARGSGPNKAQSHIIGLCGELVFALEFNLALDTHVYVGRGGDGGQDFRNVDIKTAKFWRDPWLKIAPNARHWTAWYGLVALDQDMKRGRFCGLATQEMVRYAPLKDWGYGPMHSLAPGGLLMTVPRDICRLCGGRKVGDQP